MQYKSDNQSIVMDGQIYWVNAKTSGIYTGMLNTMIDQLESMLSYHSKVHVLRFDLHQYAQTDTNKRLTTFNRRLFKWLKRKYNTNRIGFIWVREQDRATSQHYHYVLMLDGHKVSHPISIQEKAAQVWQEMSGRFYLPENPFYNIHRGNYEETQAAIYRISYLAKTRSKGKRSAQTKDIGTSRIKNNRC